MNRQELYYTLKGLTRVEKYFRDCFILNNKMPSVDYKKNIIDGIDSEFKKIAQFTNKINPNPEDTYDYICETDRLINSINYNSKNFEYLSSILTGKKLFIDEKDITIFKYPRYLNYIDLESEFIIILYILEGKSTFEIGSSSIPLQKGNVIILAPHVRHSIYYNNTDEIILSVLVRKSTFSKVFFNVLTGDDIFANFFANIISMNNSAKYIVVKSYPDDRLSSLLLEMLIELERNRVYSNKIIRSYMELFLFLLISEYNNQILTDKRQTKTDIVASSIVNYIYNNFTKVSIDDVSKHFNLSATYISRMLRQKFGRNFIQILTDIKLSKSKELLAGGELSIEDICAIVGYSNPRHFRRVFKKAFEISPSEYRANANK